MGKHRLDEAKQQMGQPGKVIVYVPPIKWKPIAHHRKGRTER